MVNLPSPYQVPRDVPANLAQHQRRFLKNEGPEVLDRDMSGKWAAWAFILRLKENQDPMRPNFDRTGNTRRNSPRAVFKVATALILSVGLASCGSVFGEDEPDLSAPLGSVATADRNSRGLTGVGRASAESNRASAMAD